MEKLEVDSKSGSDEEFYDCIGKNVSFMLLTKEKHSRIIFSFFVVLYIFFKIIIEKSKKYYIIIWKRYGMNYNYLFFYQNIFQIIARVRQKSG